MKALHCEGGNKASDGQIQIVQMCSQSVEKAYHFGAIILIKEQVMDVWIII